MNDAAQEPLSDVQTKKSIQKEPEDTVEGTSLSLVYTMDNSSSSGQLPQPKQCGSWELYRNHKELRGKAITYLAHFWYGSCRSVLKQRDRAGGENEYILSLVVINRGSQPLRLPNQCPPE